LFTASSSAVRLTSSARSASRTETPCAWTPYEDGGVFDV